ncbi:c-type cytochrome [Lichenicoccus roseus]|uniref:C-type cytochrome n=2 Tax=Lichenicoccus roseus TaxID=2683649 RepID=A0A5R9JAL0_9PROT|nr:c-type cytochrome [Lichenicoccus roseus]
MVGVQAEAADIAAGKTLAVRCSACHGPAGIAVTPDAPNLAGQNEAYLSAQLTAFHTGARQNEMMSMMAKPLTDAQIADLAAYYHSLPAK